MTLSVRQSLDALPRRQFLTLAAGVYLTPENELPVLILDFAREFYAADLSGSLAQYDEPDGVPAALILDFDADAFGSS